MFPKTTVSTLLSVIIFTGRPFPQPTFTGARGAHKRHHIIESKIHISYSENHDSTLFFFCFYMSPLSTLANTIDKGSTFSISSLFDVTKLKKKILLSHRLAAFCSQCQWTRIFISLTTPIAMGTQLCFKRH